MGLCADWKWSDCAQQLKSMDPKQQRVGMIGLVASAESLAADASPVAGALLPTSPTFHTPMILSCVAALNRVFLEGSFCAFCTPSLGSVSSASGCGTTTQGRQQRAALLLLRRFELLRKSPRSFAFLCDELSRAVERRKLSKPLLAQLTQFAVQELEKFVPEARGEEEPLKVGPLIFIKS